MPTAKQRKLAKAIIEDTAQQSHKTAAELLEVAGYGTGTQTGSPGRTIEQKGVQQALEEYGFTESNAKMVVSEIMMNSDVDPSARLKATDQVFKIKGSYAAEKHVNVSIDVTTEARLKSKEAIDQFLNGNR